MRIELEEKLVSKYPELFRDKNSPPTESLMCFGCECGDGWFEIINRACERISSHIKNRKEDTDFRWMQIKEKFGGLRLYEFGHSSEYIQGVIAMAESMSYCTCEQCGKPGAPKGKGWITTLCDECDQKRRAV